MGRSSAGRYLAGSIALMLEPRDPDGLLPPYKVMPAAKSPRYYGEQKPEKFEHQVRITDRPVG